MNKPKTMEKCRACGKQRSINAEHCPHCGDSTSFVENLVLSAILIAIGLGVLALFGLS